MISLNVRKNQRIIVLVLDQLIIYASFLFAFLLRFDFQWSTIPVTYTRNLLVLSPFISFSTLIIFYLFGLYNIVWRYISLSDYLILFVVSLIAGVVNTIFSIILNRMLPISIIIMSWSLVFVLAAAMRLIPRILVYFGMLGDKDDESSDFDKISEEIAPRMRTLIIGAGNATEILLKDIIVNKSISNAKVIGIVDDNPTLLNRRILGIPILGTVDEVVSIASKYSVEQIFFSIPSANEERRREILELCSKTGAKLRIITGYKQMISGEGPAMEVRDVTIEDLLGRDSVKTDLTEIGRYLTDKITLITGGGGSIGSELARQISKFGPKELILVDIYENNVYSIQQELLRHHPNLNLTVLIASVRDERRMCQIFESYKPEVVFHAAAHKHVPLMEVSPCEAIKNNVHGTYVTAKVSDKYNVERFILISSDKAVNPTNVMGATKRVCELIVQTIGKESQTNFVAVRFGNVLGSNGSVIPLFKKQIEEGGPLTVTHPDIMRYFMTIPEAVALVLQAGAYAENGEIYVLDMGEPVKIIDLAEKMIKLSGLKPNKDIAITFIGLRPGEKLFEELLMDEEGLRKTPNRLIYIANPTDINADEFFNKIDVMSDYANMNDSENMLVILNEIVPIQEMSTSLK